MKLDQNNCLDEITNLLKNLSGRVKNLVTSEILEKKPCVRSRGYIFSVIIMKLGQNVCLDKIFYHFENGSTRIRN